MAGICFEKKANQKSRSKYAPALLICIRNRRSSIRAGKPFLSFVDTEEKKDRIVLTIPSEEKS